MRAMLKAMVVTAFLTVAPHTAQAAVFSFDFSAGSVGGAFGSDDFDGTITINDQGALDDVQNQFVGGQPQLDQYRFHNLDMQITLSNGFDVPNSIRLDDPSINFIDLVDPGAEDRVRFQFSEDVGGSPQFFTLEWRFAGGFGFDFGSVGDIDTAAFVAAMEHATGDFNGGAFSSISFSDYGTYEFGNAGVTAVSEASESATVPVPGSVLLISMGLFGIGLVGRHRRSGRAGRHAPSGARPRF